MTRFNAHCPQCFGRGWVARAGWPVECPECCPTKIVRGKVVLDEKALAARQPQRPKPIPVFTPSKARYQGNGTTSYSWDTD